MKIRESQQGICQRKTIVIFDQYFGKTENNSYLKETKKRDATLGDIPL
jgi:phage/plasmid-associated DNA primase